METMPNIPREVKLHIIPGKDVGFPGEYLRVWLNPSGAYKYSARISGFGRDAKGKPTDLKDVPYVSPVPNERRVKVGQDVESALAKFYLRPDAVYYW